MDEEKTKIKMDDGVSRFFTSYRGNFLACGKLSHVSETQNEILVS